MSNNRFEKLKETQEAALGLTGEQNPVKEILEQGDALIEQEAAESAPITLKRSKMDLSKLVTPVVKKEKTTISVYIDIEAADVLTRLAKGTGKKKSEIINEMLLGVKKAAEEL